MEVTEKYMRLSEISLIEYSGGKPLKVSCLYGRDFRINTLSENKHKLDFESKFIFSEQYGITPAGYIIGQVGGW